MSVSEPENLSDRQEILLRDADIREPLFDYLEECFPKVRFLEEKVTGRARADVVMVLPEEIWGIEIKSDADSYARLPAQVKNYDRYYDRNVIAAGSRHALHVKEHVPEHWGILTVEWLNGGVDFYRLREPARNPGAGLRQKLSLLWRSELTSILLKNGLPKYVGKNKKYIAAVLEDRVQPEMLHAQISEELFERDYQARGF